MPPLFETLHYSGIVCGVDEAGRGPLAGSVVAAAVVLDPGQVIIGINDSKKLSEKQRKYLAEEIRSKALSWSVAEASVEEIDQLNILQATLLAMKRAVESLTIRPDMVLVDGNRCPHLQIPVKAIVKGDATVEAIGAASILAKTTRDAQLLELHKTYPVYGFDVHKGYPTAAHLAALAEFGACPVHRRSYAPVRAVLREISS